MFTRSDAIPDESVNLNDASEKARLKGQFPADSFAHWAFLEFAQQGDRTDAQVVIAALRRMARRNIPVRAKDADKILSIPEGTTSFLKRADAVSAQSVIDALEGESLLDAAGFSSGFSSGF